MTMALPILQGVNEQTVALTVYRASRDTLASMYEDIGVITSSSTTSVTSLLFTHNTLFYSIQTEPILITIITTSR